MKARLVERPFVSRLFLEINITLVSNSARETVFSLKINVQKNEKMMAPSRGNIQRYQK